LQSLPFRKKNDHTENRVYGDFAVDRIKTDWRLVDSERVDAAREQLDKFEGGRILRHSLSADVYHKLSEAHDKEGHDR
jgi:hypothetical protein